ncbi:MAG: NAD(P)/FAD-dependent oxidoreductase, partial [Planctomycetota bacterium]
MTNAGSPRIAIIGSGFSGLGLAIYLKKAGIDSFEILEKADRLGGTWRENTYPGAECDVPSPLYSFSFERNPRWSHKWSHQPEILDYLDHCASKYELGPHLRFDTEVARASFRDSDGNWELELTDGAVEIFDAVVCATGQLHQRYTPEIPGADDFEGESFHSADWNHELDLRKTRVAVIGNAASAVQFIPQIAKTAASVTVFQR